VKFVAPFLLVLLPLVPRATGAQTTESQATAADENRTTIGGQWYLNDRLGRVGGSDVHRFGVSRGYIVIRHRLTDRLSGRINPDVTLDRDGDGEGDLKVRLKYAYVDLSIDDLWIFTRPHVEFGLAHRPWLDFEEHLNYYRVQGTMFIERNGVFNSADYGVTVFSLLGGQMDPEYREQVNSSYPGRYGSFAVGVYNGGGYHGLEENTNKTLEARATLRPLPGVIPGLQLTYQGVLGKGNLDTKPDWTVNLLFASWESARLVLNGQYYWGRGNMKGTAVDAAGDALRQSGYSVFGEWRFRNPRVSVLGRYDSFDDTPDFDGGESQRFIAGVAYHLKGHSKLLLDFDTESMDGFDTLESRFLSFSVEFSF
jgi:hypothetical protein